MKIHVYTICWNEEKMLPFFIRHYQQFADKIIFFDNESTDNSRAIIESSDRCVYRSYSSGNEIRDDLYREVKNNAWKESRGEADFVIVVDADEMLYSKYNLRTYFKLLKLFGFTLIKPFGYDMVAEQVDWSTNKQITELVTIGQAFKPMCKPCVFNPNKIEEINYGFGAHSCRASGKIRSFRADWLTKHLDMGLYLLHYKRMGVDYITERHSHLKQRLSAFNKQKKLGFHYETSADDIRKEYEGYRAKSYTVIKHRI
ncbi:MAG: glycosyltransferase [Pedobacter sp.]|nr:MAG: glycosyltransferase [Pedobacter sp.]